MSGLSSSCPCGSAPAIDPPARTKQRTMSNSCSLSARLMISLLASSLHGSVWSGSALPAPSMIASTMCSISASSTGSLAPAALRRSSVSLVNRIADLNASRKARNGEPVLGAGRACRGEGSVELDGSDGASDDSGDEPPEGTARVGSSGGGEADPPVPVRVLRRGAMIDRARRAGGDDGDGWDRLGRLGLGSLELGGVSKGSRAGGCTSLRRSGEEKGRSYVSKRW